MLNDFKTLYSRGNVGFYSGCEITQLFLHRKSDKRNYHLFILVVFEEFSEKSNFAFLTDKPIVVTKEFSLGIQRYWLNTEETEDVFKELLYNNKWNLNGDLSLVVGNLRPLPKQFVPSKDKNAINTILKNNFHSGSYLLEFFDERKGDLEFLLNKDNLYKFNEVCEQIKQYVPIDLSVMRDRLGNIIFQFPINLVDVHPKALPSWDGVELDFAWNDQLSKPIECLVEVFSTFDNNYMGASIVEYTSNLQQVVKIGNLDQLNHITLWRKDPNLILSSFEGSYFRNFDINMGIINHEPRIFELDGRKVEIQITSNELNKGKSKVAEYNTFILNRLYDSEKEELIGSLSFKQYGKGTNQKDEALKDLRKLITNYGGNGIFLWDPFLTAEDIISTLYYSTTAYAPLKAIGAINDTVKMVYDKKGLSPADIMKNYSTVFANPSHNNYALNLEFRCQYENHGWPFHDRFIMFPGNETSRPRVYSLGTSINSFGKSHHILQEVSHPQMVIDAFNELWSKLDTQECVVWKSIVK